MVDQPSNSNRNIMGIAVSVLLVLGAVAAFATSSTWLPLVNPTQNESHDDHDDHDHSGHDHDDHGHEGHDHGDEHAGHDHGENVLPLSDAGLKNIGFEPLEIKLTDFTKSLVMPAMIVERPGQTQIHLAAPFTGIVTDIHVVEGEAIEPGTVMFELRLTHEDLVAAQRDFLRTAESLDVVNREIERLKSLGVGVVADRRVLEQQYEKQKLEAAMIADEQAMLLHGLSEEQVTKIRLERSLIRSIQVKAPDHFHNHDGCDGEHLLHVQKLEVTSGQQVEVGRELCVLADHCELFVEGRAFEDDAHRLREAARNDEPISMRLLVGDKKSETVEGLKLLYLSDRIDPKSRALRFYLRLPNHIVFDQKIPDGRRFVEWRYKPGQRMELMIPVDQMKQQIVLPAGAVVQEGVENYIFRQDIDVFERVSVHVKYRDGHQVVVSPYGLLKPGDVVAATGAYQMQQELKKLSGSGAIDPHAGHNH